MQITAGFTCNNKIFHYQLNFKITYIVIKDSYKNNFIASTPRAQIIVIPSTPLELFSLSKRLNKRNIIKFASTLRLTTLARAFLPIILFTYNLNDISSFENKYIIKNTKRGSNNPEIKPAKKRLLN
ncbi:MAG TPA: hypothetical protein DEQ09_00275 [Bacteroidales bacterium]|nr:hypothetical protein [Bacteroidales bacterium]